MEITPNLLLHQWYRFSSIATVEDTNNFKNLIDTYGAEKVFNAMTFSRFTGLCGAFVSIREHTEEDFMEAPEKFKDRYSQEDFETAKQKYYESILRSYNSRIYKDGRYTIVALPNNGIDTIENRTASKGNYQFEIKPNTFAEIPYGLPIRKKAVDFVSHKDSDFMYAVVYQEATTKKYIIDCLFLIKFISKREKKEYRIFRCIGKRKVKPHWLPIRKYVEEHQEDILKSSEIQFSIDW